MAEQSNRPQNPPEEAEQPEIYSVSQDQEGSFHLSRRGLVAFGAAVGGTLLLRGVCPRFAAASGPSEPARAMVMPVPKVYVHSEPSIASDIAATLKPDDLVRLVRDHPDLGWVEVTTRSGQHGWLKRGSVDFARAIKSTSPDFDLSSTPAPTPTQTEQPRSLAVQLRAEEGLPDRAVEAVRPYPCGDAIQNGGFEDGGVAWVEESTGTIIRNDWEDPYEGDWVAWMGGLDSVERLTQRFRVPADVQDAQTLKFYLKVTTEESSTEALDTLCLRFLDAGASPISADIAIADNTTMSGWLILTVDLDKMTDYAGQEIQIQFEASVNATHITSFVIDWVSLALICDEIVYYAYLPIVLRAPTPTPTNTPTATPTPSATPCPNHSSCSCDVDSGCSCDADGGCGCHSYSSCSCESDVPCVCDTYQACTCVGHYCSCEYYYW